MSEDHDGPESLLRSPLDAEHRALGAKMVPFGGWEMPIQYAGVLQEHRACREHAVVFDVSHLGSVSVRGPGALDALQWAFTNDLRRVAPGRAQYTHLLDPDDAHVVDDIIVWWVADDDFVVMPNASNTAPILDALRDAAARHATSECAIDDITATRVVLAVQGPEARTLLGKWWPEAAEVPRFAVRRLTRAGRECIVAGTGYTGEDGVELHVPVGIAPDCWRSVLATGVTPAGLGARDTLRLEAGLPLHGHELGPGITPLQAGLGWVVRADKGDFRGRGALLAEERLGVPRLLGGIVLDGRQVPRAGCEVLHDDVRAGEVTSGNFSPVLERGIALAFLDPSLGVGHRVDVDIRGKRVPGEIVELPFRPRGSRG